MGSKVDDNNKFSWVIKNFNYKKIYYHQFIIGGYKWKLTAYPKGVDNVSNFTLCLAVANRESLSSGLNRHAEVSLTVVNQFLELLSHREELQTWFDEKNPYWGFRVTLPLATLHDKDSWFLGINGELNILVEIDVLEVIGGTLDESQEATQHLKNIKQGNNDCVSCSDLLDKTQQFEENVEVYGFLVLPSQVESVKRIFETHLDIASGVRTKSNNLRTTYINVLLGLVKTLCQSPHELTDDDLKEASMAVSCMVSAGFKVDWLEEKLHQVLEKKSRVQSGEVRLIEMEQKLLKLNKECSDFKVLLEREKAEVAAAKTPLSFVDFL